MKYGWIGRIGPITRDLIAQGLVPVAKPVNDDLDEFVALGAQSIADYREFWDRLEHPRAILMDMPAGKEVDLLIDEAYQTMEPADVVIDCSPSYWCDTLRRYRRMRHRALYYVDVAWIERAGERLLIVGGDEAAVKQARPFLSACAADFRHIGGPGIAHYAAVIDECVQAAVAQVRNEAALMMEAWPAAMDDDRIKRLWPLIEPPRIGRAAWQLDDAVQLEAATPLLAQTAMQAVADALEQHESTAPPPRVGPFQHPDEIM